MVRPGHELKAGADWYLPFAEDSRLILCVLLLIACLRPEDDFLSDQDPAVYGLKLRSTCCKIPTVYIVSEASWRENPQPAASAHPSPADGPPLAYCIAVPSLSSTAAEGRWLIKLAEDHVRAGRYLPIGIGDLIKQAGTPEHLPEAIRAACAGRRRARHQARLRPIHPRSEP
ncbi:MAG: hypothetical protein GKR94_26170 [Gammaproteobacteria bacterium]|nr:hypothetical protein [Gammaproteobacteria bacterium]